MDTRYRECVVRLHQALSIALDHSTRANLSAVADAVEDVNRSAALKRGDPNDSEWTELHCAALALQLRRRLGSSAPDWLRFYIGCQTLPATAARPGQSV
jgi:hypothetical protein